MMERTETKGLLVLVSTPIGNDDDLSPRAVDMLGRADVIYCEDTRVTGLLLQRLGLDKPLRSHHAHNERQRAEEAVDRVRQGQVVAIVSDAGMPAISDPGERIVRLAAEAGIPVTAVPGANAALTALSLSALSAARFSFEGFLPVKGKARRERLEAIANERRTVILYEAPHRLEATLADLSAGGLSERRLTLARELTKRYEEIAFGTVASQLAACADKKPRGEYVLVLEGLDEYGQRRPATETRQAVNAEIAAALAAGLSKKALRAKLMTDYGLSRNEAYERIEAAAQGGGDGFGEPSR